jgi:hypothetical protein
VPDNEALGSALRFESHVLELEPEVRDALAWLVKQGGAPPSEVLDFLAKREPFQPQ